MIRQTIVWTLLPDPAAPPAADGTTRLTLLASPRLTADDVVPLSRYPELAGWPGVPLRIAVEIVGPAGPVTVPAEFVDAPPDAALWRAVFPPDLPVVPFVFDRGPAENPLLSYPAAALLASLAHEYGRQFGATETGSAEAAAAADDDSYPRSAPGWEEVDRLIRVVGDGARTRFAGSGARARLDAAPDDLAEDPAGWSRLAEFHRPRPSEGPARPPGLTGRDGPARRDFHAVFAALADHPRLQASLGLVRELRVRLPAGQAGPVTIRAVPSHPAGLSDYRPRTRCVAVAGQLRLAAANGAEAPLYLPLDDTSRYAAIDVDIDAAGLALRSYASSLALASRDRPAPRLRPPAPRSDGIFVAEADRQIHFKAALLRAADVLDADLAAGGDGGAIFLDAGDVQQGYRVDVFDVDSGRWYPLCRRVGAYRVAGVTAPLPIDDEGTVSDVLAASEGEAPANLLHQSLFRWNGWSLVVPPPGLMVDLDEQPAEPVPEPADDLPFSMNVTVAPGTLPSLRYGRGYRFRARLVNIAGRSVPFSRDPAVPTPATPTLRHSRYEPVPSPVLVPRRPVTEGESAAVMVVRTDNSDPANPRPGPDCERHVLAPKAAVQTLERHGALDVPGENRLDPQAHALLFERDKRVVAGSPDAGASGTPFIDADTVALPWLPDPFAHGIAIHGLPASPGLHLDWPRGGAWHARRPVRLIVAPGRDAGPAPPVIDPAGRTIRVVLEPGASLTTTLSSRLGEGTEEVLGTWRWFADAPGRAAAHVAARRGDAAAGRIGQLTPPYEVRMIHAVRCPHRPPAFSVPRIERSPGDTAYELADPAVAIHPDSTAAVHVEAQWSDTVDDLTQPKPVQHAGRSLLELSDEDRLAAWGAAPAAPTVPFRAGAGLGDTRHHVVRFTPVATSRFATYFTQRRTLRLTGTQAVRLGDGLVPGTVVVTDRAVPAPNTYRLDRDVAVDHAAGTIARRPDGTLQDGTEVDVAFVVPPVTRAGPAVTLSVPATTRPAPPAVHRVGPAYAWRRERDGNTIMSTRRGGLLRIYLDRPWFDSGEGELLAVIVADDALRELSQETWAQTLPFASGAGADPTGLGGGAPDLARAAFPRAVKSMIVRVPGLRDTHPEHAANALFRVRAVGHPVEFDPHRRLWFSDIEVRHETDQPFVRLKLARLQSDALRPASAASPEDLHISQIVDAGFHQLPTDRTTTVVIDGSRARVTVTGPADTDITSEVTVTVRAGGQDGGDPIMWEGLDRLPRTTLIAGPPVGGGAIRQWTGLVDLPAAPPPGSRPAQLLVREHQLLPGGPSPGGPGRRPSYLDVVDL